MGLGTALGYSVGKGIENMTTQKEASAKHVLHPTTFNTALGLAAGALGALEEHNRTKDLHRTDMIQRQIDDLKGREGSGDFNVMDKARLLKLEMDGKVQGFREKHPGITTALNAMTNAAFAYLAGSAVQRTYGPKQQFHIKGAASEAAELAKIILPATIPGAIATGVGAIRGYNEGEGQNMPTRLGRSALGAFGTSTGAPIGSALYGTGYGLGGAALGGLAGGLLGLPFGKSDELAMLGGLGAGLGGVLYGGIKGLFRGGKFGGDVARKASDTAFGKSPKALAEEAEVMGKSAAAELLDVGLEQFAQLTDRTSDELTLEEKLAFIENYAHAMQEGVNKVAFYDIAQEGFNRDVPQEVRAQRMLEQYKANAEADIPWHSGKVPGVVGGLAAGIPAGFMALLEGASNKKALGIGAGVGIPVSAGLMYLQNQMANKNKALAAEAAKQSPEEILQHIRNVDLDSLQSQDSFPDKDVRQRAYKSIDHLMKGASVQERVLLVAAAQELDKIAYVPGSAEAMETGSSPYTQSHATTAPIPSQQMQGPAPKEPGLFDKIKPYLGPAAMIGGGMLLGHLGTTGVQKFKLGTEKQQALASRYFGVPKADAIKILTNPATSNDVRAGIRHAASNLDVADVNTLLKLPDDQLKGALGTYEGAKGYLDSLVAQDLAPVGEAAKIVTAEVNRDALNPDNLTMEQALRPYTGGLAGMVGGGLTGRVVGGRHSLLAPVAGTLLGYAGGNFLGRHSLSPEAQVALREFEQQATEGAARLPDMLLSELNTPQIAPSVEKTAEDGGLLSTLNEYKWPIIGGTVGTGLLGAGLYKGVGQLMKNRSTLGRASAAVRNSENIPTGVAESIDDLQNWLFSKATNPETGEAVADLINRIDGGVGALKDRLAQLRG
jgi:hypothetical protein